MIIAILSILVLTGFVYVLNKKLLTQICPICAGVTLTWLWMFFGMFFGKLSAIDYQVPTAILAGGTVVGLMSKLEEFIKVKFVLVWKTIFVASGFMAVYSLVAREWSILALGIIINVAITFIFKTYENETKNSDPKKLEELKKKMKGCC